MKFGLLQLRRNLNNNKPSEYPTGIGYIASYVEKYLPEIETIIEVNPQRLLESQPDIIGISSVSATFNNAIELSKKIKNKFNIPIIIGGHHITALPNHLHETMDIGVLAEGEETTLKILNLILKNKLYDENELSKIDGIVYHSKDGLKINPVKSVIQDLDSIPLPKIDKRLCLGQNLEPTLITSRGCPFNCSFCYTKNFWNKTRYHSPKRVLEEIINIIKIFPNQKTIRIYDDIFAIDKKRLKTIVELIKNENIHKKVNFTCFARASVFDDEICNLLLEMNIKYVDFGFESGNEKILKYLKGNYASVKQNQKAIEICEKYGLAIRGAFIIASPTETLEEVANTYWFLRKNLKRISQFTVCHATPLPSTDLWDYCIEKNIIKENNINWDIMHGDYFYNQSIHINQNYSKEQVKKIIDAFYYPNFSYEYYKNYAKDDYYKHLYKKIEKLIKEFNLTDLKDITNISDRLKKEIDIKEVKFILEKELENNLLGLISLHNIDTEKDINTIFELGKNKLVKNGKLIFSFYNSLNISVFYDLCFGNWFSEKVNIYNKSKFHFLSLNQIYNILEQKGFKILYVEPIKINIKEYENFSNDFLKIVSKLKPSNKLIDDFYTLSYIILAEL